MEKYYKIYGSVEYIFEGGNSIYIKVTKETKDRIEGYEVLNWQGNHVHEKPRFEKEKLKITFIKNNLTAWKEVIERTF